MMGWTTLLFIVLVYLASPNEGQYYEGVTLEDYVAEVQRNQGSKSLQNTLPSFIPNTKFSLSGCPPLLDLLFLFDTSGSIRSLYSEHVLWATAILRTIPIGRQLVRVAAVQYAGMPLTEFSLNTYANSRDVVGHLEGMRFRSGVTRTAQALKRARMDLLSTVRGGRPGAKKVIVLFSDGQSIDNPSYISEDMRDLEKITIYAVGFGKDAFTQELEAITGDKKKVFRSDGLLRLREAIMGDMQASRRCFDPYKPRAREFVSGSFFKSLPDVQETPQAPAEMIHVQETNANPELIKILTQSRLTTSIPAPTSSTPVSTSTTTTDTPATNTETTVASFTSSIEPSTTIKSTPITTTSELVTTVSSTTIGNTSDSPSTILNPTDSKITNNSSTSKIFNQTSGEEYIANNETEPVTDLLTNENITNDTSSEESSSTLLFTSRTPENETDLIFNNTTEAEFSTTKKGEATTQETPVASNSENFASLPVIPTNNLNELVFLNSKSFKRPGRRCARGTDDAGLSYSNFCSDSAPLNVVQEKELLVPEISQISGNHLEGNSGNQQVATNQFDDPQFALLLENPAVVKNLNEDILSWNRRPFFPVKKFQRLIPHRAHIANCPLDIMFVLDSSGSVKDSFKEQVEILKNTVELLNVSPLEHRVAVMQFAGKHSQHLEFAFNTYSNNRGVIHALDHMTHYTGTTYIGKALGAVKRYLNSRRNNVPTMIVLISDGYSQDYAKYEALALRSIPNVHLFAVGLSKQNDRAFLSDLTGSDSRVFVGQGALIKFTDNVLSSQWC